MPSLKDLAKECGVSVATVSKALNDQPDIAPATRERIRAAARRMGYLPNAAARALKTNRTYNLGVLFVDEKQSGLTHEYFSAVLDSFKVEAEKRGYDITFINHNISGKSMSYLEHCHYRGVDGVVIACVNFYDPQVVELVNGDVPVVTIDHVFNNRMAILSDNVVGTKALVQQAWACGHRRIAFIHGEKTAVTENRLAGFYQACEELGLKVPEEYVRCGVYHDVDRCAEETRALLALPQRPTCIIFPDDFSALGGYNALTEAGLSIPEDISVMGYDGIYLSRVVKPPLVTYQQNTKSLGRLAADKLIELIEHPRVTLPEQYVRCGVYHDVDRCAEETRALLALPQRPTCIIFPDDFSALGGYNALAEAGLSIPEDISVMGYDGIYLSRVVKPSLVTYQQNTKALGRLAADKLIELIEHPRVTLPEQIRVSGKLLDGGSVRIL